MKIISFSLTELMKDRPKIINFFLYRNVFLTNSSKVMKIKISEHKTNLTPKILNISRKLKEHFKYVLNRSTRNKLVPYCPAIV